MNRDGSGDLAAEIAETDDGWSAVVVLPLEGPAEGALVSFDVGVVDGDTTATWNVPGTLGSLTLIEDLSYTEAVRPAAPPTIDAIVDESWTAANTVATDTIVEGGADGASAVVSTLWDDDTLYVLAEVTDATPDVSASDPYQQDSVEVFLDPGNTKNGAYLGDDAQIRISAENVVSFGAGSSDAERIESATTYTDTGYIVEASITLLGEGGEGTFQGVDFQVNDGDAGTRTSVRTWAEPTGTGYQTTARWGVVRLVGSVEPPAPVCDRTIEGGASGTVLVLGGTTCVAPDAVVRGTVLVLAGGSLVVDDATVRGRILALSGGSIDVSGSVVRGTVIAVGTRAVEISDNEIRGSVSLFGNRGDVRVTGNDVRGSMSVLYTRSDEPAVIGGNDVRGGLACRANDPAPVDGGEPNSVRGRATDQCAALVSNS